MIIAILRRNISGYSYKGDINELCRVLKEEGYLILSLPFLYPVHEEPFDFYRFTTNGIKHILERNGMEIEYEIYRKISLEKLLKHGITSGLGKTISTGYFIIAQKKRK